MSDDQKKTRQGFQGFCADMSGGDMMRKMMVKSRGGDAKKEKESAPHNP